MAERTLSVKLKADIGQYKKAMADASSSTDSLARAGQAVQNAGKSVSSVGDSLTKKLTVPLVLAGGAAVKMAGDFDATFTQMQTLAGVSAGEVDGLKDSVLGLAGETGKAPQELAEALYFLRSSGLDGAQAMDALEVSAKASAAGLGDTVVLADAVSSAMMAYAKSGLTAAEATDVLVATARAGKAEPSELAGQLGRLIPISSELGISFADVGGAIAALSTKGNDAAMASTQLLGVMGKLLKPSEQASKLLGEVGLSTDTIRQSLAEKGLLGTLEELKAKLGENGFIKFLEDQQAVQGGLALLGGDLNKTKDIFAQVNDAAGATDEAFGKWAESMGAQNAQAFAKFQVALIQIGDALAPIAADVASFAASLIESFSNLPSGVRGAIIAFAAVAAAVGPLMSAGGRVISVLGMLQKAFAGMQAWTVPAGSISGAFSQTEASATAASGAVGGMGTVMKALPFAFAIGGAIAYAHTLGQTTINAEELTSALASQDDALRRSGERAVEDLIAVGQLDDAVSKLADTNIEGAERLVAAAEAAGLHGEALRQVKDIIKEKAEADATAASDQQANSEAVQEATGAYEDQAAGVQEATTALQDYVDTLKAQTDPLFAAMDAITGNRDAQVAYQDALLGVQEAQAAVDEAISQHGAKSSEAADAQRALEDAQRKVTDAQWGTVESAAGVDSALASLQDAVDTGVISVEDFRGTLQQWVEQGLITQGQADAAAFSIGGLANQAEDANSKRVNIPVSETGSAHAQANISAVQQAAINAGRERPNVHTSTSGTAEAQNRLWGVRDAANSIPGSKTVWVEAKLRDLTFGWLGSSGKRAAGGPVGGGKLYEVAEQGKAELLEMGGRTYLIPGSDGTVVPAGAMAAAGAMASGPAGGGITITGNVTVVANDPQALVTGLIRWTRQNGPVPIRVSG